MGIFVENGSEYSGRVSDLRTNHRKATTDSNQSGKLSDSCFFATFDGSRRGECLNVQSFEKIDDAQAKIEAW